MSEITAQSLVIAGEPRRRGRPRVHERKVPITAHVPPAYYDRIAKAASARGAHMSTVLCEVLMKVFPLR